MKKVLALVLALVFVLSLAACGGDNNSQPQESQAVSDVEALIDGIGTVTTKSGDAITKAETEYSILTSDEKAQVSNYNKLKKAKDDYEDIVTDFLIGRWERTRAASYDSDKFSKGDTLNDTMVIFDGYCRVVTTKNNIRVGDDTYEWYIEDGLLKLKFIAVDGKDLYSYQIDFNNETLREGSAVAFQKVSDDPNYYLN